MSKLDRYFEMYDNPYDNMIKLLLYNKYYQYESCIGIACDDCIFNDEKYNSICDESNHDKMIKKAEEMKKDWLNRVNNGR